MHLQLEGQPTHNVVAVGAHDVSGLNAVDHGAPLGSAKGDTSLTVTSDYFLLIFNDNRSLSLSDPRKRLGEIKPYLENFNLETENIYSKLLSDRFWLVTNYPFFA